ncbi:glycosyltransferase family 1 protein [Sandarakinorhabdus sp.]|uniref:glycosyltransferase family 4 protein n=1 Tax=Sandarakinorhabdus sp. TaxID=1916663 RepID=UPI003340B349
MRLLIDLQGLQNNSRDRGIGRYVEALARGLLRNADGHNIRFLLNNLFPDQVERVIAAFAPIVGRDRFHVLHAVGPTAALHDPDRWRHAAAHIAYAQLVADLDPDVLLIGSLFEGGADNSVACVAPADQRRYRVATILYDLIPLLNPDQHIGSAGARRWYFDKIGQARHADLLMAISASALDECITHLPSDADHAIEISGAAADHFANLDLHALRTSPDARAVLAYHGIERPFLMHVSALDPRKNFEGLIEAYARLPLPVRQAHQLVLVCRLHPHGHARLRHVMAQHGLDDRDVVLTGHVPDDELQILYANCALFVFPSFHEGFGLPVLEAMWCGAPAVGSCLSSVPEVIGRADALFDPRDMAQMVDVIARALSDQAFRSSLIDHAHSHARAFSWDLVAQRALAGLARLASLPHQRPISVPPDADAITKALIASIAAIDAWPGPSDNDLTALAEAIEQNERQTWPRVASPSFGMDMASSL